MAEIASLSTHTKQLLQNQIDCLEQDIARIEASLEAATAIDLDHESGQRIEIARKYQQIGDLQILIDEVPTLEAGVAGVST